MLCGCLYLVEKVPVEIRQRNDVRLGGIAAVLPPLGRDRPQAFGQVKFVPIGLQDFFYPLARGDQELYRQVRGQGHAAPMPDLSNFVRR